MCLPGQENFYSAIPDTLQNSLIFVFRNLRGELTAAS